jgi:glutaredoxin
MNSPKLELYYFEACPYCQLVLEVIEDLSLKVEYKDIRKDEASLSKLIQDTGRRTVPCMYIDGKPMHESSDIMNWLKKNQDHLEKE